MYRGTTNAFIRNPISKIFGIVFLSILMAEIGYYHFFDMEGVLPMMLSFEMPADQGWWDRERKVLWSLGSLWGFLLGGRMTLR